MNYSFFLSSLLSLLLSVSSEPAFGTPIIPNECGSLGSNNPMIAKDCQTFKLSSGYCCYLTITVTEKDPATGNDINVERTACIISPNNNPKKKAELINKFSYLNGDVLIECSTSILSLMNSYYMIVSMAALLLLL